ncbi:MAG TPA: hypothetical protein VKS79_16065 [Gemmataceae bacterium]|nr:hypothetical protein [Gemmataceae bacterium]
MKRRVFSLGARCGSHYFHLAQAYLLDNRRSEALYAWKRARQKYDLKPHDLHPLERADFERLQKLLETT